LGDFFDPGSGTFIPGPASTFDATGAATGQLPIFPTYSWVGNAYQGQVYQIFAPPLDYAQTFAALSGSNQSANGTAIKESPYPRLKSCIQPNTNTICPYDSLLVGLEALQSKVAGNCPDCVRYIFSKMNSSSDQMQFSRFIGRFPGFFDGTKSTLKLFRTCDLPVTSSTPWDAGYGCYAGDVGYSGPGLTVGDYFAQNPGVTALAKYQPSNAQNPAGKGGLVIFFNPSTICTTSALWNSACQIENQSKMFHEGLHEYYGLADETVQRIFGLPVQKCTANISDYISFTIFNSNVNSCN
jgi:hypothetical protein